MLRISQVNFPQCEKFVDPNSLLVQNGGVISDYYLLQIPMALVPNVGLVFDTKTSFESFGEKLAAIAEGSVPRPPLRTDIYQAFFVQSMQHMEFLIKKVDFIVGNTGKCI